ncbi:hypothetical protein, partial [Hyunsoonleella pacifica]|uniref:hypothetical protein n=1 Tax=Hyunsoonleella pacifica TaxID=1080224 RepID=UPI001664DABA
MMSNNKVTLFYVIVILWSVHLFSQTEVERQKIAASYNTAAIENLKSTLRENNRLKQVRVSAYLDAHQYQPRRIKVGSKVYAIYDIVNGKPIYRTTDNIASAK